ANSRSTVHRSAYLDYIGFKIFDADGTVVGERRFLGLFSSAAYQGSVRELPVVRRKVAAVLERSGLSPRSHSGRDLIAVLEDYPPGHVDVPAIQEKLSEATRDWDDDFRVILERKLGEQQGRDLFERYAAAFPDAYKDEHTPFEAVKDIAKLELLDEPGELSMHASRR